MNIEQLKYAKSVGATHTNVAGVLFKKVDFYNWLSYSAYIGKWVVCEFQDCIESMLFPIDFAPLNDYQQDKALDIAVTGIAE